MIEYRKDKNWKGLRARTRLKKKYIFIDALLWESQDALQANVITDDEYLIACYVEFPDRNFSLGQIGEFDFCMDELGVGTIAHELTHFITDVNKNLPSDGEWLADWVEEMAEKLVAEFMANPLTNSAEYV